MAGAKLLLAALGTLAAVACATVGRVEPAREPEEAEEPPAEAPPELAAEATAAATVEFTVTTEIYQKTFEEIDTAVAELTAIITARDYDRWVDRLTEEYVKRTSSPEYLAEVSEGALLKKAGVRLRSLRDFFDYVVVPARSQATVDRIDFVDATHVKAITLVAEEPYILYWLVREDSRWKIGIW